MKEFQLIEKFFKPLTKSNKAAQGLIDDVAKISLKKNEELVLSKDLFVEDVHFLAKDGAFKIASKLLRANLSDLASSGAKPLHYVLGFSKNKNTDENFFLEFARGLKLLQDEFSLSLIGGDTVSSDKLFFSITIFGVAKKGKILSRSQAQVGDLIFVSGTIGDAFLGRTLLKSDKYLRDRHFFPTPRIKLGEQLLKKNLSQCAIDISDGLLSDLRHICQSSELAAEINLDQVPISASAKKILQKNSQIKILDLASAGDDYELIFSVNPKNLQKVYRLRKALGLDLTCIGEFKNSDDKKFSLNVYDKKNQKIQIKKFGYEH
jgi:thiamine-monophosphate kinase